MEEGRREEGNPGSAEGFFSSLWLNTSWCMIVKKMTQSQRTNNHKVSVVQILELHKHEKSS